MRKGRTAPRTAAELEKSKQTAKNNRIFIQEALAEVITGEWIEYDDMHRRVNEIMRQKTGKANYDAEYLCLSEALERFGQTHGIERRTEQTGWHYGQRKTWIRLKGAHKA